MAHCFARRCRAARKDFLAARRAAFRASAVSGSSSLDPSSSGRTLVTPGIHDLNEFKIAEKFLRIELSSVSTKVKKSRIKKSQFTYVLLFHCETHNETII